MTGVRTTVIVPCHNAKDYLEMCISSIMAQDFKDYELLLIDDGSTDGSSEICDRLAKKDVRIRVMHQENKGLVRTRKEGILQARGEYITFVDSDDWIELEHIRNLWEASKDGKYDVIVAGASAWYQGSVIRQDNACMDNYDNAEDMGNLHRKMLCFAPYFSMGMLPYLCNKLMRRSVLLETMDVIPDSITVGEDVAFLMGALLRAGSVRFINAYGYHYRIRLDSMMGMGDPARELDNIRMLHGYLTKLFEAQQRKEALLEQLNHFTVHQLLTRCFSITDIWAGREGLFPFRLLREAGRISVYGAGAFGKAVYRHLKDEDGFETGYWIDRQAHIYQNIGLPVVTVEDVSEMPDDEIVVAIFQDFVAESVKKNLILRYSLSSDRVHPLHITAEDEDKLLSRLTVAGD